MNQGILIVLGCLITFSLSWYGLVFTPAMQLGKAVPAKVQAIDPLYPLAKTGSANQGREVYRSQGCVVCHSQQVGAENQNSDLARGWGKRNSVAQDYIFEQPAFLGSLRIGPDLMNVGSRMPDRNWHLLHLFNPRTVVPKSNMPRYPYLFETRKAGRQPHPDALRLTGPFAPAAGYEVIPKSEALALVSYLTGLQAEGAVFEVPPPKKAGGDTNAPAADTNAPAAGASNSVPADASGTNTRPVTATNSAPAVAK